MSTCPCPFRFCAFAAALLLSALMPARLPAQNSTYTPATITSPASGSVLNDSTITFSWSGASSTTGYGITGYRVQLITTGFAGIQVTAIDQSAAAWDSSATISGLPADCSTITVRLITEFNSQYGAQWYSHDNTYIAAGPNAMATMVSPAPGSVLDGASALFRWTASASSSAGGYQLNVGTTPGGGDLFSNKLTKATDQTVNGLPTNGTPIYVRLSTLLGGVWANNDYSYVAAGGLTGSGAKLQQGTAPSITPPIIPGGTTQPAGGSGGTATKAVISSPTPGTTLGGSTVTFTWNAVSGASAYSLAVGTGPTDAKFFDQNIGLATSQTVTGLPTDGSSIAVRLVTQLSGTWQENDYTYTAAGTSGGAATKAAITSPAPGTTLGGSTVTFTWNAVSGASAYSLAVGTGPTDAKYFDQVVGLATSQGVTGLPTDGSTIAVRLATQVNGKWQENDYTYTTAAVTKAGITSPAPGTTLGGTTVTFTWNTISGASAYGLAVGSAPTDAKFFDQTVGLATSQTVSGLPSDGSTVSVRLSTQFNGTWQENDYTYATVAGTKAGISSPAPGTTLGGSSVTFTWNGGSGATAYGLYVGSAPGGNNIFSLTGGTATSMTATKLPTDGSTIYVRLLTQFGSVWQYNDYTYTAAGTAGSTTKAVMTSPTPASTLAGSSETFTWNAGSGATAYGLHVGSTPGGNNLFSLTGFVATTYPVTGLPTDGSPVYVRLWTQFGSGWQYNDYTYTAAGTGTSGTSGTSGSASTTATAAAITSPAPSSTLSDSSATFTWNAVPGATGYALVIGTATNNTDVFNKNLGLATSQTVTGIPTDGSYIYVRLWTSVGSATLYSDSNYKTAVSTAAVITSPAPGSTLSNSSATFTWNAVPGATGYALVIGTATNNTDVFNKNLGLVTSQTVTGIPTDGSYIYVRLWTSVGSATLYSDYSYKTASSAAGSTTGAPVPPAAKGAVAQPPPLVPAPRATAAGPVTVPVAGTVTKPALAAGTLTPVATATPTTPAAAGQTPALLANFPVPPGAVRTSFTSSLTKSTLQERAAYTTAAAPDAVLGSYAPQIAVAGWNEVARTQSGDAAAHTIQLTADFLNGATKAHVVVAQNAQGATTISVTVTTIYPGNSAPALSTSSAAASATGAATSASDRGTADPANFPRLPGSIRSSFTTSRQTTFSQEIATYTAKCAPASADAFYGQNLPGAGWEELTRDENLNDASKGDQISEKWQNGSRTAVIALSGSTAGGCDVRVSITTQTAP